MDDHEQFVITGLEEKVLDVAEKDIWGSVSFTQHKHSWRREISYRSSGNPLVTGIVDRSDGSQPPQATACRPEPGERTPQEA